MRNGELTTCDTIRGSCPAHPPMLAQRRRGAGGVKPLLLRLLRIAPLRYASAVHPSLLSRGDHGNRQQHYAGKRRETLQRDGRVCEELS